jgi:hypothetical protein
MHKSEDPDPWHVGVRKQVTRITQLPITGEADSYMIPTCQPCGRECTTQQHHSAVPLHVDVTSETQLVTSRLRKADSLTKNAVCYYYL